MKKEKFKLNQKLISRLEAFRFLSDFFDRFALEDLIIAAFLGIIIKCAVDAKHADRKNTFSKICADFEIDRTLSRPCTATARDKRDFYYRL